MNQKSNSTKPNALASLRKVIREEVKSAIKEEMVPILLEIIKANSGRSITEAALKPTAPINTPQPLAPPSTNPFLEQTRQEMLAKIGLGESMDDFSRMISPSRPSLSEYSSQPIQEQLEDPMYQVNKMLITANKSMKEEMVEINEVPDFTAVMKKMNL